MIYKYLYIVFLIVLLSGCNEFGGRIHNTIPPNVEEEIQFTCTHIQGVPLLCGVKHQRTITERVEIIVTEVIEIIVEVEVIKETITEIIVTEFQTIYVTTEPDINEIVPEVVERVKELVDEEHIRDVPIEEIVEEVVTELL